MKVLTQAVLAWLILHQASAQIPYFSAFQIPVKLKLSKTGHPNRRYEDAKKSQTTDSRRGSASRKSSALRESKSGEKAELPNLVDHLWAVQNYLYDIVGYGCWCHFGDEYQKGRGRVVDEVDGSCKELARGYHCIHMDALKRNESCNPATRGIMSGRFDC